MSVKVMSYVLQSKVTFWIRKLKLPVKIYRMFKL